MVILRIGKTCENQGSKLIHLSGTRNVAVCYIPNINQSEHGMLYIRIAMIGQSNVPLSVLGMLRISIATDKCRFDNEFELYNRKKIMVYYVIQVVKQ